jgi:hypothetical protein
MALLVWFVSPFLRSSVVLELPSSSHSPRLPVPEPGQALNVLLSLPSKSHPRPHKDTLMLCNPILGLAIPWEINCRRKTCKTKKNPQSFQRRKIHNLSELERTLPWMRWNCRQILPHDDWRVRMLLTHRARRKLDRLVRKLLKQISTKIQLRWPQSTNEGLHKLKNDRRDRLDSIHTNPNKEEHDMAQSWW